jgi:hypothetical protein
MLSLAGSASCSGEMCGVAHAVGIAFEQTLTDQLLYLF